MVIYAFPWDASTSVANLTETQIQQLCALIGNSTISPVELVTNSTTVHDDLVTSTSAAIASSFLHQRPPSYLVWGIGLTFVTIINMCAVLGIGVMRYLTKDAYNQVITLFVGLGVGSLSGSSFYHLLPQAHPSLMEETDEHGHLTHSYLHMAHFSLLGVYLFFMCDKVIKIVLEMRKRNRSQIVTVHASERDEVSNRSDSALVPNKSDLNENKNLLVQENGKKCESAEIEMMKLESNAGKSMGDQAHGICVHDHSVEFRVGDSAIAAVAWMIIFGDGFHNFIDGISIGASFAESLHAGLSVSLAVLAEEFPHELGDVAILVASGMTLRQALLYNLLSAITCYVGFVIGVGIGELGPDVSKYAFALAGGMFLYISLGCMMPEMKKAMEEALNVSMKRGLYVLFLQSVGLFTGLFLMYFMARYGEEISI
ncbi:metal cation transporter, ZIP family [Necator americanus]|uniref:Metal cation transporter, ZIP family n=1 Tax=Necator americanus TaxID=51031 RepID=W2TF15_NECAM|nr:metal cation transporter, ZIP family [Necator americanus]ETN80418.1 metal cation transporter, ZIP family [Necator americanus]